MRNANFRNELQRSFQVALALQQQGGSNDGTIIHEASGSGRERRARAGSATAQQPQSGQDERQLRYQLQTFSVLQSAVAWRRHVCSRPNKRDSSGFSSLRTTRKRSDLSPERRSFSLVVVPPPSCHR